MAMGFSCARKAAVAISLSALLTGCFDEATPAAKSVDWYKAHNADRQAMMEKCSQNPGELGDTPDCKNAIAAESALSVGSLK
jgi:hypothetical protein